MSQVYHCRTEKWNCNNEDPENQLARSSLIHEDTSMVLMFLFFDICTLFHDMLSGNIRYCIIMDSQGNPAQKRTKAKPINLNLLMLDLSLFFEVIEM